MRSKTASLICVVHQDEFKLAHVSNDFGHDGVAECVWIWRLLLDPEKVVGLEKGAQLVEQFYDEDEIRSLHNQWNQRLNVLGTNRERGILDIVSRIKTSQPVPISIAIWWTNCYDWVYVIDLDTRMYEVYYKTVKRVQPNDSRFEDVCSRYGYANLPELVVHFPITDLPPSEEAFKEALSTALRSERKQEGAYYPPVSKVRWGNKGGSKQSVEVHVTLDDQFWWKDELKQLEQSIHTSCTEGEKVLIRRQIAHLLWKQGHLLMAHKYTLQAQQESQNWMEDDIPTSMILIAVARNNASALSAKSIEWSKRYLDDTLAFLDSRSMSQQLLVDRKDLKLVIRIEIVAHYLHSRHFTAAYELAQKLNTEQNIPKELKARVKSILATTHMAKGDLRVAIKVQESVLAWLNKHYGGDHPQALITKANLGGSHHKLQQWQEALELQTDTLETMRAIFGPDHFETILTTINTGWTYYRLGLFEEAKGLFSRVLPSQWTRFDESHPNTILARMMLAKTLEMQGESHEAWEQMAAVAK
ncbi:hypothetical protein LTR17_027561, partial [Elasticomyces elasticus]